jgi:ABC-type transporter Mla MlaB component
LALLVDLRGYARGAATPLQFRSPPPQLLHLAEASGLSLWFEADGQASQ